MNPTGESCAICGLQVPPDIVRIAKERAAEKRSPLVAFICPAHGPGQGVGG